MSYAKVVRIRKEREAQMPMGAPRSYCRDPGCMFRIWTRDGYVECPKHPGLNPEAKQRSEATPCGEGRSNAVEKQSEEASPVAVPRCEKCNDAWGHCHNCNRCSFYLPQNGLCKHCQPSPF